MKYIKKVDVTQLVTNTGTIIDSMNSGDDQHTNAPSIDAVKNYLDNKGYNVKYNLLETAQTNSTTTYQAFGESMTLTTTGKPLIVIATAVGFTTARNLNIKLLIDGQLDNGMIMTTDSSSKARIVGFKIFNNLSVGQHTFRLTFAVSDTPATATISPYHNNSIIAFEI